MDESLRIPYYFPPQRYIPRLGGQRESPQTGASGFFSGLKDAMDLYLQLQSAKEAREERAQERQDRLHSEDTRHADSEADRRIRLKESDERASALQAQRELAEGEYAQRTGITMDPALIRQRMEQRNPVAPKINFRGLPAGVPNEPALGPMQEEAGLSDIFERGTKAREQAERERRPITFEGGIATPSPASERYDFRATEAADRLRETKLRVAAQRYDDWLARRGAYASQRVAEYKAKNPFPVPGASDQPLVDSAYADFERFTPRPRFDKDVESDLGIQDTGVPQHNPTDASAPGHTENQSTTNGVDPQNAAAFQRRLEKMRSGRP